MQDQNITNTIETTRNLMVLSPNDYTDSDSASENEYPDTVPGYDLNEHEEQPEFLMDSLDGTPPCFGKLFAAGSRQ